MEHTVVELVYEFDEKSYREYIYTSIPHSCCTCGFLKIDTVCINLVVRS